MHDKNFVDKLKILGLNSYEGKLWVALLSRGTSTAGELSSIANVPRSRSYDVLESLEKKGFIMVKLGKPIKYNAIEPVEVIERVKKQLNKDAGSRLVKLDEAKDSEVITELSLLHKQGIELIDPSDISGSIRGRDNIYNHLLFMIKEAKDSVVISTTNSGFKRKMPQLLYQLKKANKRGVQIKIASNLDSSCDDLVKELNKIGVVKNLSSSSRFLITDESELLFMLSDDKTIHPDYDVAVWANTGFFAKSFQSLFDSCWDSQ